MFFMKKVARHTKKAAGGSLHRLLINQLFQNLVHAPAARQTFLRRYIFCNCFIQFPSFPLQLTQQRLPILYRFGCHLSFELLRFLLFLSERPRSR